MKQVASALMLLLCAAQLSVAQARPSNQQPDPKAEAAYRARVTAFRQKNIPQIQARAQAARQARLAKAQLTRINRTQSLYASLSQRIKPAARPALQEPMSRIQAASARLQQTNTAMSEAEIWTQMAPHKFVTAVPQCPGALSIASLSVPSGQPGDPVQIHGAGFQTGASVQFLVANGNRQAATIQYQDCTDMVVSVPQVTGLNAYNGVVIVANGGGPTQSVSSAFQFQPTIVTQMLTVSANNVTWSDPTCPTGNNSPLFTAAETYCGFLNGMGLQSAMGGIVAGAKYDDKYFFGMQLKNGWVLDSVDLTTDSDPPSPNTNARVQTASVGSPSPFTDIHSWVDAYAMEGYEVTVYIHGPAGLPYQ